MHGLEGYTPDSIFWDGCSILHHLAGGPFPSRAGDVYRLPVPLTTVYKRPDRRVLFNPLRDANPFFHYIEALWMLAGRNDVRSVARFAKRMAEFSDDGDTLNGAYGYRWRNYFGHDQLVNAVHLLKADRTSRRIVIGMWDPSEDLCAVSKDLPCNISIKFAWNPSTNKLDMMVSNRSNDMIWGGWGANLVHMSVVHEYVATMADLPLGVYYQISMDAHYYARHHDLVSDTWDLRVLYDPYLEGAIDPIPLVANKETFEKELQDFFAWLSDGAPLVEYELDNPAILDAYNMAFAWDDRKSDYFNSLCHVSIMDSPDWKLACTQWLERHQPK